MVALKHPSNGYQVEIRKAPLWALIFGPLYFAKHGAWFHALASLVVAMLTYGLSWPVYALLAQEAVRKSYLSSGWIDVSS